MSKYKLIVENFRKWLNEDLTPHWGDKEKSHWSSSSESEPEAAPEPAAEPEPEPEATPKRETPGYKEGIPCVKLLHQLRFISKFRLEPHYVQKKWLKNPPDDGYYYDTGNKIWREPYAPNNQDVFWAKKDYQKCMNAQSSPDDDIIKESEE